MEYAIKTLIISFTRNPHVLFMKVYFTKKVRKQYDKPNKNQTSFLFYRDKVDFWQIEL